MAAIDWDGNREADQEITTKKTDGMINSLITNLSTGWNVMRWLRLGLGLFVAYQAVIHHDALAGVVAVLFFVQVITNRGCCGSQPCDISESKSIDDKLNKEPR